MGSEKEVYIIEGAKHNTVILFKALRTKPSGQLADQYPAMVPCNEPRRIRTIDIDLKRS